MIQETPEELGEWDQQDLTFTMLASMKEAVPRTCAPGGPKAWLFLPAPSAGLRSLNSPALPTCKKQAGDALEASMSSRKKDKGEKEKQ